MNDWLARQLVNTNRLSMWSMLYLRGSGGMPPQKNFANLAYSVLNLVISRVIFLTEK